MREFEKVGSALEPEIFGKAEAFRDIILVLEDQEGLKLGGHLVASGVRACLFTQRMVNMQEKSAT